MKKVLLGILFWFLNLTWGFIMTFIGLIVTGFCILFLKGKVHRNGYSYIVEIGGNWGGLDLGAVALCGGYTTKALDEKWFQHTRRHESGHGWQNMIWGPLFPFVIAIPSAIRYHYQNWRSKKGLENKPYDAIWFEWQATRWGTKMIDYIEAK